MPGRSPHVTDREVARRGWRIAILTLAVSAASIANRFTYDDLAIIATNDRVGTSVDVTPAPIATPEAADPLSGEAREGRRTA